ncbi:MAG: glutamine--tRNA ligase/YqeY domain fusion protein, partial [Longimicrobiales bacterium]
TRVDIGKLEYAVRDDLNRRVPRVLAVLRPLRVVITNWAGAGAGAGELLTAPYYPRDVPLEGTRDLPFDREILIERDDFMEDPPSDWHRLAPGAEVRLRYAYFIRCDEVVRDEAGDVVELRCTYDPETRGGRAPDGRKPNGTIHWVSASRSLPCTVRLYDRLFTVPDPDAAATDTDTDVTAFLNPDSLVTLDGARIEPSVYGDPPGFRYQFERLGYFSRDVVDSKAGLLVYNRIVSLRDTWSRGIEARGQAGSDFSASVERAHPKPASHSTPRSPSIPERSAELQARRERYEAARVSAEAAEVITRDEETADFFDAATTAAAADASAHGVASWLVNELRGARGDRALAGLPFAPADFAALVARVEGDAISSSAGRDVLARMVETGDAPDAIIERLGLAQISDDAALLPVIEEVLAENRGKVDEYRNGKTGLLGFFMGQVMRRTSGRANPEVAQRLLEESLAV